MYSCCIITSFSLSRFFSLCFAYSYFVVFHFLECDQMMTSISCIAWSMHHVLPRPTLTLSFHTLLSLSPPLSSFLPPCSLPCLSLCLSPCLSPSLSVSHIQQVALAQARQTRVLIAEMNYDPQEGRWKIKHFRHDKQSPNHINTAFSAMGTNLLVTNVACMRSPTPRCCCSCTRYASSF